MTKFPPITQFRTKRLVAEALKARMRPHGEWSISELAKLMDCSRSSVINRIDDETDKHKMTVHELLHLTNQDGPAAGNWIFAAVGYQLVADECAGTANALGAAGGAARCAAALIDAAADDKLTPAEWRALLPMLEALDAEISTLLVQGRDALRGERS